MNPFVLDNLRPVLRGRRVLLGVSGSIAAFKACDVVRHLREAGAEVQVALTDSAERFVTRVTLETLSGRPVLASLWEDGGRGTHHIDTARWAELALLAPATANTIAKLAQGLASDLLSTELLAFRGPLLVAPAMNPAMFAHPATQANLKLLSERGCRVLGPAHGRTSCGEEGPGRMLEAEELVEAAAQAFYVPARGERLILTLGPTQSAIDPVRYLTNRSSGLMGAALAWAAVSRGFEITAVSGPSQAPLPAGIRIERVRTAAEMAERSLEAWRDPSARVFVGAAAVLDWDVANPASGKIKKETGPLELRFSRNRDILAEASQARGAGRFVLGFAAETENLLEAARAKLAAKGCDAIFANDVSGAATGFESSRNAGWWIDRGSSQKSPEASKAELGNWIIDRLVASLDAERSDRKSPSDAPSGLPGRIPPSPREDTARA